MDYSPRSLMESRPCTRPASQLSETVKKAKERAFPPGRFRCQSVGVERRRGKVNSKPIFFFPSIALPPHRSSCPFQQVLQATNSRNWEIRDALSLFFHSAASLHSCQTFNPCCFLQFSPRRRGERINCYSWESNLWEEERKERKIIWTWPPTI